MVEKGTLLPGERPSNLPTKPSNHYFDNDLVESLVARYVKETSCTDLDMRNEIMSHAGELIYQIIRTHKLNSIYPGGDAASFGDLFQVAWMQIEKTLYKFDDSPGHPKIFNLWSQIAKTVMLAHIKRESRDGKNFESLRSHVSNKPTRKPVLMERFINEAKEVCQFNDEHLLLLDHLIKIYKMDPNPSDGIVGKLTEQSGMPRAKVLQFFMALRLRSHEFTDSPTNDDSAETGKWRFSTDSGGNDDEAN